MKEFYDLYFEDYRNLAFNEQIYPFLDEFAQLAKKIRSTDKKLIFTGNGASAAISAHGAVDFTKQAKVRSITFNEAVAAVDGNVNRVISRLVGYDVVLYAGDRKIRSTNFFAR